MSKKEELFQLIKSLKGNEKRYFKLFANLHSDSSEKNYLTLFDIMDAQEVFNEEVVKKKINSKHYSRLKNYLHSLILKSMRSYNDAFSAQTRILNLLSDAEFLFGKGLLEQSDRTIDKAIKLAIKHERNALLPGLYNWKRRIIHKWGYSYMSISEFNELIDQENSNALDLDLIREYSNLLFQFDYTRANWGQPRNIEELKKEEDIVNHQLIQNYEKARTTAAKSSALFLLASFYNGTKEWELCYKYAKLGLELFESNPEYLESEKLSYISKVFNLTMPCMQLAKFDEAFALLEKVKNIKTNTSIEASYLFELYNRSTLYIHLLTGNFDDAVSVTQQINDEIYKHSKFIPDQNVLFLRYYMVVSLFGAEEYKKSLKEINYVLNHNWGNLRGDLIICLKILYLIIHFEIGNRTHLEYAVRSTFRYLINKNKLYKFERIILDYIRKEMPSINTQKELIDSFKSLRDQFTELMNDPIEKTGLSYFGYVQWLTAKIEGITFADVIRRESGYEPSRK